jgi:hypothetical protein
MLNKFEDCKRIISKDMPYPKLDLTLELNALVYNKLWRHVYDTMCHIRDRVVDTAK